jgi:hypothetical protein
VQVLLEGHLSYEQPLVQVLQQILSSARAGATVLQLADPMTGARGDILINDSRVLVGAQMYEPKAMGYPALKTLCAFALADFRLVQPDAAKANRGDHSLNLEIDKMLRFLPELPESPEQIDNPLERIFNNYNHVAGPVEPRMARLDPMHETNNQMEAAPGLPPAAEGWRALRRNGSNGQDSTRALRPELQSLADRMMDELPASEVHHPAPESERPAKIKYRASNPFKSPSTFFLTIFSLLKILVPRVVLPGLAIFLLYKAGSQYLETHKDLPGFNNNVTNTSTAQPSHRPAVAAPVKTLFPRAKPRVAAPVASVAPAVEPVVQPVHHGAPEAPHAKQPPTKPAAKHDSLKHSSAHGKAEPAPAAVKAAPASNEPIPEYKGPSSATGEPTKHRHAYQTMPSE